MSKEIILYGIFTIFSCVGFFGSLKLAIVAVESFDEMSWLYEILTAISIIICLFSVACFLFFFPEFLKFCFLKLHVKIISFLNNVTWNL